MNLLLPFDSYALNGATILFYLAILTHLKNAIKARKFSLKNKVAFITGGSEGSGLATAKYIVQRGGHVTIVSRSQEKLEKAVQELQQLRVSESQKILSYSADVTNIEQVQKAVEFSNKEQNQVPDYVIMVAGLARPGYFEEQDIKLHKQLMEVNYFGCVNTTKVILPHLIERNQGGKLVYFSSAVAICGMIGYTQYCPSKFALRGFCDSLKNELLPYGIDVHLFLPSNIDTPGFVEENKTKPIETQIIEGQGQTFSAEQVTKDLFNGIAKGQYTITNEILIEFGRICSDGPVQTNNIFLDMFVMPIVPLFRFIFQMVQYVVVKKYSKQRLEKAKKSKETANKKEN